MAEFCYHPNAVVTVGLGAVPIMDCPDCPAYFLGWLAQAPALVPWCLGSPPDAAEEPLPQGLLQVRAPRHHTDPH